MFVTRKTILTRILKNKEHIFTVTKRVAHSVFSRSLIVGNNK